MRLVGAGELAPDSQVVVTGARVDSRSGLGLEKDVPGREGITG